MKSCAAFNLVKAGKSFQQNLNKFKWFDDRSNWKLIIAL